MQLNTKTYVVLGLIGISHLIATQDDHPPADEVRALQNNYQAERAAGEQAGNTRLFSASLFQRADELARRGTAALIAGRLNEARDAFRQARWQLPYPPLRLPEHVRRILGSGKLRHAGAVNAVAFSPDGTVLATAGVDSRVVLWETATGKELLSVTEPEEPVVQETVLPYIPCAVAFHPKGGLFASACGNKTIRLWETATGKECRSFVGHSDQVTALVFSPDGKALVSASKDQTVRIWEVESARLTRTFGRHQQAVVSVDVSADGKYLASLGVDGRLWIVDFATGDAILPMHPSHRVVRPRQPAGCQVTFAPDRPWLATCGDETVKIYDLGGNNPLERLALRIPPGPVTAIRFSRDGKNLVTAGPEVDGSFGIRLWDLTTGQTTRTFRGHHSLVRALAISPDGHLLASGGDDQSARIWDVVIHDRPRVLAEHQGPIWAVAVSPDGKQALSAGADRAVRTWDIETGRELRSLPGHQSAVLAAVFSPDGRSILSAGGDKVLRLWDATNGKELRTFTGHQGIVTAVATSPDGKRLASGSADRTIRIWDMDSGKVLAVIEGHQAVVTAVAFRPDGKLLASCSGDWTVRLWAVEGNGQPAPRGTLAGHTAAVTTLAFSPDGTQLATGGGDGRILLWEASGRSPDSRLFSPQAALGSTGPPLGAVAFSPDGKLLAAGGSDRVIRLWDLATRQELRALRGHQDWVSSLAFSPDGKLLTSASADGRIFLWEIGGKQAGAEFHGHLRQVKAVAFTPDGKLLVSASLDRTLRLWDAATGEEVRKLNGHAAGVTGLALAPSGQVAASVGRDRTLRLWDLVAGKELAVAPDLPSVPEYPVFTADGEQVVVFVPPAEIHIYDRAGALLRKLGPVHEQEVVCVAFSPDASLAALGDANGTVRLWDVTKGERIGGDWGAHSALADLAFLPGRRALLTVGGDGVIKIWDLAKRQQPERTWAGQSRQVLAIVFNADGKRVVTLARDRTLRLWETETGRELRKWHLPGPAASVALAPDGGTVAVANEDTTVYLLQCP